MSDQNKTWAVWVEDRVEQGVFEVQAPSAYIARVRAVDAMRAEGREAEAADVCAAPLWLSQDVADLRTENRRLRQILDTLTRAGLGKGALIEVFSGPHHGGVVVCRADVDEKCFLTDCRAAIEVLARALGDTVEGKTSYRSGVTAADPHQGEGGA
jgi:hypothetical protein